MKRQTEPDPGMMQSIEEQQDIPKGEATVMPVGEPRKQHRVRNLVAKCRQKIKERTGGKKGIQEEVGCRLQEGVPLCKSSMAKKETRQENWDPGKLWTLKGVLPCRNKDDPQYESDTGERTWTPETSQK
jgi:hypothetical protein